MILHYLLQNRILIDGIAFGFNEERDAVRLKLQGVYTPDDQIIHLGNSETESIYQRRDSYKDFNHTKNLFFLNYDTNDRLSEVEVHFCDQITVVSTLFDFNDNLDYIASIISEHSQKISHSDGEYFFKDLKIVIMDKQKMGGEGITLGYFYCASDVTHLE